MNGVESATGAQQRVHAILGRGNSPPTVDGGGALTSARQAVRRVMASVGFVDIAGQMQENLDIFLNRDPVEIAAKDFNPQFLEQLASWVLSKMSENSHEAEQAQAHVRPDAAVKLLR